MDISSAAQRADMARITFEEWITEQLKFDPAAAPLSLVNECIKTLGKEPEFVYGWVFGTLRDHVAAHLSRHGGAYDAPDIPVAHSQPPKPGMNGNGGYHSGPRRSPPKAKAVEPWKSFLTSDKVPTRVKLMRRGDLVAVIANSREQATTHAMTARLAETILSRMPEDNPGMKVCDAWTDEELLEAERAIKTPATVTAIDVVLDRLEQLP